MRLHISLSVTNYPDKILKGSVFLALYLSTFDPSKYTPALGGVQHQVCLDLPQSEQSKGQS